ncbi:hypothetical protein A9K75_08680 [Campylobacter fetus subsp. testudinum]|uniref:hypothetical protein n=1 Tax=Campylobacter fetus TaxID=196 RepID=UPI0008189E65|nr:hypothetical protein [Campylobacter fetus]OCR99037.1 hypothetical protein A9K75_08680 [Campylobacter fetus subsp. testudinum]
MTNLYELKLGSETLEALQVVLEAIDKFPDEINKLDLSKFTTIANKTEALANDVYAQKDSINSIKNEFEQEGLEFKAEFQKSKLDLLSIKNEKEFIEQKSTEFKTVLNELRNLKNEIGDISLKNIIDNVISGNAQNYFETSLNTLLDRAKYKDFISKAESLYYNYKDELESLSSGATSAILNLKNSASASLSEVALSSKNDITSSVISAKTELKTLETTIKSGVIDLKNDVFNAADEKRELVNKSILEANAVINRVTDASYLEQVQQVVNVGAWERVLLNINLLDITFIKATNMAYERDTTNIRNEVALMMQEVESDRVEIAKLKADSKEFLERSVSAASVAEWNSYLEVI